MKKEPKGFKWTGWIKEFNVNKDTQYVEPFKVSMFLLNTSKYKSGKKKGQYKYIEMKGLKWDK